MNYEEFLKNNFADHLDPKSNKLSHSFNRKIEVVRNDQPDLFGEENDTKESYNN